MNNNYKQMMAELLDIEEKNNLFNLTRTERAYFHDYIWHCIRVEKNYENALSLISISKPREGTEEEYSQGWMDARDAIGRLLDEVYHG